MRKHRQADTEVSAKLYTVQEAAELAKVSCAQIRAMLSEGEIQGIKVGALWRVNKDAFDAFLGLGESVA